MLERVRYRIMSEKNTRGILNALVLAASVVVCPDVVVVSPEVDALILLVPNGEG